MWSNDATITNYDGRCSGISSAVEGGSGIRSRAGGRAGRSIGEREQLGGVEGAGRETDVGGKTKFAPMLHTYIDNRLGL